MKQMRMQMISVLMMLALVTVSVSFLVQPASGWLRNGDYGAGSIGAHEIMVEEAVSVLTGTDFSVANAYLGSLKYGVSYEDDDTGHGETVPGQNHFLDPLSHVSEDLGTGLFMSAAEHAAELWNEAVYYWNLNYYSYAMQLLGQAIHLMTDAGDPLSHGTPYNSLDYKARHDANEPVMDLVANDVRNGLINPTYSPVWEYLLATEKGNYYTGPDYWEGTFDNGHIATSRSDAFDYADLAAHYGWTWLCYLDPEGVSNIEGFDDDDIEGADLYDYFWCYGDMPVTDISMILYFRGAWALTIDFDYIDITDWAFDTMGYVYLYGGYGGAANTQYYCEDYSYSAPDVVAYGDTARIRVQVLDSGGDTDCEIDQFYVWDDVSKDTICNSPLSGYTNEKYACYNLFKKYTELAAGMIELFFDVVAPGTPTLNQPTCSYPNDDACLSWSAVTGADYYEIWCSGPGISGIIATVYGTSYTHWNLPTGTYTYWVRAVDNRGSGSDLAGSWSSSRSISIDEWCQLYIYWYAMLVDYDNDDWPKGSGEIFAYTYSGLDNHYMRVPGSGWWDLNDGDYVYPGVYLTYNQYMLHSQSFRICIDPKEDDYGDDDMAGFCDGWFTADSYADGCWRYPWWGTDFGDFRLWVQFIVYDC
jgi:hypothetical protein